MRISVTLMSTYSFFDLISVTPSICSLEISSLDSIWPRIQGFKSETVENALKGEEESVHSGGIWWLAVWFLMASHSRETIGKRVIKRKLQELMINFNSQKGGEKR